MRKSKSCMWDVGNEGSLFVAYVTGDGTDVFFDGQSTLTVLPYEPILGYPTYTFAGQILEGDSYLVIDVHDGQ